MESTPEYDYINFYTVAYDRAKHQVDMVMALACCCMVLRIIKFLSHSDQFKILERTLTRAGNDVASFFIILFIFVFGFALMSAFMFGA